MGCRGVQCDVLGEHMTTEVPGEIHMEEAGWGGDTQHPQLFLEVSEVRQCVCVWGGWAKLGNTGAPGATGNCPVRERWTRKTDPAEPCWWVMRVEDSRTQVGFPSSRGKKSFSRKPDPRAA